MSHKIPLGSLISDTDSLTAYRDAIHIAIAPVTAAETLLAGDHVGFRVDGKVGLTNNPIGIVDPFLPKGVKAGDQFYLLLYPNTITSLRHEWTHPAFENQQPQANAEAATKEISKRWMQNWAIRNMADRDDPLELAYERAILAGDNLHVGSFESARDDIDNTWWDHWENITGKKGQRGEYFSCEC